MNKSCSRWEDTTHRLKFRQSIPTFIPPNLPSALLDAFLIRIRMEEITQQLREPTPFNLDSSPSYSSVPPIYDANGKRINTPENLYRQKLLKEREMLVEQAIKMDPTFKPPPNFKITKKQFSKKIFIPVKEYPDYPFIGLILGPRGNSHKILEKETGTKIAIRGKGSLKEGKKILEKNETLEELHVLITSDSETSLKKAIEKINQLLIPIPDHENPLKKNQLYELANLNGTLRKRTNEFSLFSVSNRRRVCCSICYEESHPSMDCPLKTSHRNTCVSVDQEFERFLSELQDS